MPDLHTLARYAVFAAFSLSVLVAFASWLVRARRVWPFGAVRRWRRVLIGAVYGLVSAPLPVRVFGAWFGVFRYSRWMRPVYALTDWLVEPIRRVLPPMGALDWSPLVACLVLWLLKQLLLSVLFY